MNTNNTRSLNNTALIALLTVLSEGAAEGKTMNDLQAVGAEIDTLTNDWSTAEKVAVYSEIGTIFNTGDTASAALTDAKIAGSELGAEVKGAAQEVKAEIKNAAHRAGEALSDAVHSRPAVTTARVLKTVGKIALVGSGVGLVGVGALYVYRRVWGGSESEPVIDITVNS